MVTDLLQAVIKPHSHLASRLLGHVKRWSTDDPTHEYVTSAIIVLLAGVDKVLSLALELLYLAAMSIGHGCGDGDGQPT